MRTWRNDKARRAAGFPSPTSLSAVVLRAGDRTGTGVQDNGKGCPLRLRVVCWRGERLITRGHLTPLGHPALPPPYFHGGSVIVAPRDSFGKEAENEYGARSSGKSADCSPLFLLRTGCTQRKQGSRGGVVLAMHPLARLPRSEGRDPTLPGLRGSSPCEKAAMSILRRETAEAEVSPEEAPIHNLCATIAPQRTRLPQDRRAVAARPMGWFQARSRKRGLCESRIETGD